ncbi:unnamed protein product [marine sediment metagenome]|uniref:Uncharacterized protein n=1 Tax=marine sediment metagenome TaxID=412755 RepID=X1ERM4_9ZZZZ
MGRLYIKQYDPPWDWTPISISYFWTMFREYSPNDEGVINLANYKQLKLVHYPYNTLIRVSLTLWKWNGEYWYDGEEKWYYDWGGSPSVEGVDYHPFPYIDVSIIDNWAVTKWNLDEVPEGIRNSVVLLNFVFTAQDGETDIGNKIKSFLAETIEQDQAFIM